MSEVIQQEALVFFLSVLHGIALSLLYDVLRALRRVFRHGLAAVSAEDFLFWLAAGFFTFCLLFAWTDGVLRGYVGAGIGLGAAGYHLTVSRQVVRGLSAVLKLLLSLVTFIIGIFGRLSGKVRRTAGKAALFLSIPVGKICIKREKKIAISGKNRYNKKRNRCNQDHSGRRIKVQRGRNHGRKKEKKAQQE